VPHARQFARRLLSWRQIDPGRRDAVDLATTEACSNAVRHAASGGSYEMRVRLDDSLYVAEVLDQGAGFDADPVFNPPADAVSGRGLWLISRLVDQLVLSPRHPTGTRLWFAVQLAG
jgi:serine/threonine-protein kinase RsbW